MNEDKQYQPSVFSTIFIFFLMNQERTRKLKTRRPMYECRYDERLKTKVEKSTRLTYTGLLGEVEHLKIKTNKDEVNRREVF